MLDTSNKAQVVSEIVSFISENSFDVINSDMSVIELGPHKGKFTEQLLKKTPNVSVVEFFTPMIRKLTKKFGDTINLINDDFSKAVRSCGEYDVVVLYGVLYHSHAPLALLEDIVNYIKPKIILLETFETPSDTSVTIHEEAVGITGSRQSATKTCGYSFQIGRGIYDNSLQRMGYEKDSSFKLINYHKIDELAQLIKFKDKSEYSCYRLS